MPISLGNRNTPAAMTYLGDGEMSEYSDERMCSLCGVRVHNFRMIHPILRYDPSRAYYQRIGIHRGWKVEQRIGWACGKHRQIDQNWLPQGVDNNNADAYTCDMVTIENWPEEMQAIRHKLGLSRMKMAAQMGIDPSTLFGWETGRRRLPELAIKLARFLLSNYEAQRNAS